MWLPRWGCGELGIMLLCTVVKGCGVVRNGVHQWGKTKSLTKGIQPDLS